VPASLSRRHVLRLGAGAGLLLGAAACSPFGAGTTDPGASPGAAGTTSWPPLPPSRREVAKGPRAPKPGRTAGGLAMLAQQDGERLLLHTTGGDLDFWGGVNLGSTTPGHQPGELAMTAEDYRRWFPMMRARGVRVLRIYTIHPPAFYTELKAYNEAHADDPIYLVHGIYLPDESYLESADLFADGPTQAMIAEVRDASAAVHGRLRRDRTPGRASGVWTADVSPWTAAWLVGVEWDPVAATASDKTNAGRPAVRGRYFATTPEASPTERWIAARMDELATAEAAAGCCVPIALVNWPTADPLKHPQEPLEREDQLSVDANHVRPTASWPAGTFASYHAYPYYPDFQRLQPSYTSTADPYRAYLLDLKAHHAGMPLMITELGVPGSLGSAHIGTLGRDQGHHDEAEQMRMNAEMVHLVADAGLAGALLFGWADEWFKFTWNTLPRHAAVAPDRRALWHDVLTNEQWFGLIASDPVPVGRRVVHEARDGVRSVALDHDASYLYLTIETDGEPPTYEIGFDVLPGTGARLPSGAGAGRDDVALVVDAKAGTAQCLVRADLDPVALDGLPAGTAPKPREDGWLLHRLTLNKPYDVPTTTIHRPPELQDVGDLIKGRWEPDAAERDSRATWRIERGDRLTTLRVRLPWGLLLFADPSSRSAYAPRGGKAVATVVDKVTTTLVADGRTVRFDIGWDEWNAAKHVERPKRGIEQVGQELARYAG
jgi:hypothetical protein